MLVLVGIAVAQIASLAGSEDVDLIVIATRYTIITTDEPYAIMAQIVVI